MGFFGGFGFGGRIWKVVSDGECGCLVRVGLGWVFFILLGVRREAYLRFEGGYLWVLWG